METIPTIQTPVTFQPKQEKAYELSNITPVLFFGGSKGGGKSYFIRGREVLRRAEFPESKGLIVRKTYPELLANHIRPFFQEYPAVREWYNKAEKTIYWPNGSTTEFSYLQHTDDVYTYQGREYEDISVDEVTQHEWEVVRILRSSNRTTNKLIKPTMVLTGNPGGIGHQDIKRIFIDRHFRQGENPADFAFVPAFVQDNKALMEADPEYIKRLEDLPEHLKKAYLYGDWNIFSGLAFTELQRRVHVIKPFELPQHTKYFGAYDWGYRHPFAFVLCAITVDKKIYVVSYLTKQGKLPPEQAELIKRVVGDKRIKIYVSPDAFSQKGGPKIIDQLRDTAPEYTWIRANDDRVQGVATLRKVFAYEGTKTGVPTLQFFENTEALFDQVSAMQYDEHKPEDVVKVDSDDFGFGGDDGYDALRYAVHTYINPPKSPDPKKDIRSGSYILEQIAEAEREEVANSWAF